MEPTTSEPEVPEKILGKHCPHETLDQKGRCTACGAWAVLTGQVPVANPKRTRGV